MVVRSHQYADSILRAINAHAGNVPSPQVSTPVSRSTTTQSSIDSTVKASTPSNPGAGGNWQNADSATRAKWRAKRAADDSTGTVKWQRNPDAAAAWQNADSATRAKWKAKHAAGDSTGKAGKWQGNTDGSAPQSKPANTGGYGSAGAPGASGMPGGMGAMIANMKMSIGHIYGKIIDGSTKKAMSYVSVSLYTMRDSLVTGQLSEDNGDFSFSDLRVGAYNVKVSFIGYKELVSKVVITPTKSEQDIGNLTISPDAQQLKEVDVTGQKSTVELKVDRKVFNVGNDISSRGGTGLDVMKNIPSVSIDADGNVTLRNNTPQVYIDGKPTTLTLEQIPADQIDKVEVITNPSAKYEAASSGGIINVVMKKNTKPGYNGIVNLNIATNTGYNGLAMLNLKEKKFGVNLMYTVNGATNHTYGYFNTARDSLGHITGKTDQGINSTFKRLFQVARVGFDFFINNRNTLSISQNAVFGNFNTTDNIGIAVDSANVNKINGSEVNTQLNHFRNFTTDMSFKHTYPKEGKEYTLDVQYNHSNGGGNYLYTTNYSNLQGEVIPGYPSYETTVGGQHSDMVTFLGDFSLPIGKNMKIETGFRSNYKLTYSYNNVTNQGTDSGVISSPLFNQSLSSNYRIDDLVNGAYITFTHQIKGFSYQLGFRAEEVFYRGTSYLNGDQSFSYEYPTTTNIGQSIPKMLFPSFNISQKWGTQHELQFNVARKSNRPNFFQIAPFIFSSTATSVQRGNPALQPEFVNQGELNYNYSGSKVSWLTSAYGRYVQQAITTVDLDSNTSQGNITIATFANAKYSASGGWENILKIFPVKKLDITLTGNVFYTDITGSTNDGNTSNSGWSWLAKGIISYKFPMDFTAQVNGTYEAPKILLQGKTTPLYYFDVSLAKDFGFFTLNFTVSDVLNTRASGSHLVETGSEPDVTTLVDQSRRRDQRYAKLGVSFRFGKMDASLFKKKKPSSPDTGGGDMGF
jgi:outer membrane receptor protein involved in Fe transport